MKRGGIIVNPGTEPAPLERPRDAITFKIHEADEPLLCGAIRYSFGWDGRQDFRVREHPDIGREVDQLDGAKWFTVARRPDSLAPWIPADMSEAEFYAAWRWWGEGHRAGYAAGDWGGAQRVRREVKSLRAIGREVWKWLGYQWFMATAAWRYRSWKRSEAIR